MNGATEPEPADTETEPTPDATDAREGMEAIAEAFARADIDGCCVVDGWGCHLGVRSGELVIKDGLANDRRERRYPPVGSQLRRVLVLGHASLTTDALGWCAAHDVAIVVLDHNGNPIMSSAGGTNDARLRRVQALAPTSPLGAEIAKTLLGIKLAGHARVARGQLGCREAAEAIEAMAGALEAAETIDECREWEAAAAGCYWTAWSNNPAVSLRFAASEVSRGRIPEHWKRFDSRRSLLGSGSSNRRAERPLNSILNYLYALAEVECRIACLAVGIDPALGMVHMDKAGRDSMALDLAEVVRPEVESFVLDMATGRTFRRRDFWKGSDGQTRVLMPLSHDLSASMGRWGQVVAPWAEKVAHLLASGVETKIGRPTPLTGSARRSAQAKVKARKALAAASSERAAKQAGVTRAEPEGLALWSCPQCGGRVDNPRRVRCDRCIEADPKQAPAIRQSRARAISSRRQAEAGWSAHHPAGPVDTTWAREMLLPALAGVKLSAICAATSCPKASASGWRNGRHVPHPMHWAALATLAGVELPSEATC